MSTSSHSALGQTFLRTLWTFQALASTPIVFFLSIGAYSHFLFTFETIYDLVTTLCNAIFAGAIIFIVLVQRSISEERSTVHLTLRFEIMKSTLATIMWAWLMSDALLNPLNRYRFYDRVMRMKAAAVTAILLFVLFYPSVWYAARRCRCSLLEVDLQESREHERSTLLRRPWPPHLLDE